MRAALPAEALDRIDRLLINRLQDGLPLRHDPFAVVALETGIAEAEVTQRIARLREIGAITRFGPDGAVALRIDGDLLRHFPATDRLEVDGVRIQATAPDGRVTLATARHAVANGDGSEIQLLGGAEVISQQPGGERLEVRGEFLHAFMQTELVKSHKPVTVVRGSDQFSGDTMVYNKLEGLVSLDGRVKVRLESNQPPRQR